MPSYDDRKDSPVLLELLKEPYRNGGLGDAWDDHILARSWGFRPQAITTPAHIWHGRRDTYARIPYARYWARRLPHCETTIYPDARHDVLLTRLSDILAWLAA